MMRFLFAGWCGGMKLLSRRRWALRWASRRPEKAGVGKRSEFGFARHAGKATVMPISCCLRDALLVARDKIPVDVALFAKRLSAEYHEARGSRGAQYDLRARLEHDQLVPAKAACLARNLDCAAHDVGCALDVFGADGKSRTILQCNIGIEQVGESARRRAETVQ